jgi:hypothetical protein
MVSWFDPQVWIITGIAIAVILFIAIYFKALFGGGR